MNRVFTVRSVLIGLVLLAGGLAGPLVAQLADASPDVPAVSAFATRTSSPTNTRDMRNATATPSPRASATFAPSATPVPSTTWTPSPTPTVTSVPMPAGMVLIPAGYFRMGSSRGPLSEAPEHPVLLDAFYLDAFEVSNADYQACVSSQVCHVARYTSSFTRVGYRDSADFASYPVMGVSWDDAHSYCQWAGKRLPSEAEWEYAAGGAENLTWPWGNAYELDWSAAGARDTQPVNSFAEGVSPFGVHNLAGNVAEWVADVYVIGYYAESPPLNPLAAGDGYFRLYRGGSFGNRDPLAYTTSRRIAAPRTFYQVDLGFRCALTAPAVAADQPHAMRQALVGEFCAIYAAYRPDTPCP